MIFKPSKSLVRFIKPDPYRKRGLHLWRKITKERQLVIVGSASRTGSTWLTNLLSSICVLYPLSLPNDLAGEQLPCDIDLTLLLRKITIPYGWYFHKTHALPPVSGYDQHDGNVKFLTITRDPRDVVVSTSFFLANLPEDHGGWGETYRQLDETNRILRVIEGGEFIIVRLREWFNCPFAYQARYENLLTNGVEELVRILNFLGYSFNLQTIRHYYNSRSFQKISGRSAGVEKGENFYRKGIAGDWKNKFTSECVDAFKNSRHGEWQDLLTELGYEKNAEW